MGAEGAHIELTFGSAAMGHSTHNAADVRGDVTLYLDYTILFCRITSLYQRALSLGVRFCVAKST